MANKYWVGGTGNWDASTTTNWSDTDGGAGGAAVPSFTSDVFINGNSGGGIITKNASANVASLNFTGFTGTFTGIYPVSLFTGNFTLVAGMTCSWTGTLLTKASSGTQIITSAGKTIGSLNVQSAGAITTIADDLFISLTGAKVTLTSGTFDANNKNITASGFDSNNTNTRILNMGSGLWTLGGNFSGQGWGTINSSGLTLNNQGSTIKIVDTNAANINFSGGGLTYNNVWFARGASTQNITILGNNTFNDFKDTGTGTHNIILTGTTQIVSTFTVNGNSGNLITISNGTLSAPSGIISCNYIKPTNNIATGGATWNAFTANGSVDGGGNTGWNFAPPVVLSGGAFLFNMLG